MRESTMPVPGQNPEEKWRNPKLTLEENQELEDIVKKLDGVSAFEVVKSDEIYEVVQRGRELTRKAGQNYESINKKSPNR